METATLITAFTTLFVIIDPIGLTPLFVAMTQGRSARSRRQIGLRACAIAAAILLAFSFFGEALLEFVGIGMPAFRIAGGLLLFLTALDMLFERRTARRKGQAEDADDDDAAEDPSVFPLAIPLIAGPGAIATMILLTGQATGPAEFAAYIGVMLAVLLVTFLCFLVAPPIERALGRIGITVVTRLFGMLLAALAVQFILDGLRSSGFGG